MPWPVSLLTNTDLQPRGTLTPAWRVSQFQTYAGHPVPLCPHWSSGFFSFPKKHCFISSSVLLSRGLWIMSRHQTTDKSQSSDRLTGFPEGQRAKASGGASPRSCSWCVPPKLQGLHFYLFLTPGRRLPHPPPLPGAAWELRDSCPVRLARRFCLAPAVTCRLRRTRGHSWGKTAGSGSEWDVIEMSTCGVLGIRRYLVPPPYLTGRETEAQREEGSTQSHSAAGQPAGLRGPALCSVPAATLDFHCVTRGIDAAAMAFAFW